MFAKKNVPVEDLDFDEGSLRGLLPTHSSLISNRENYCYVKEYKNRLHDGLKIYDSLPNLG